MEFITLYDGSIVHTQALNPNPLTGIQTMKTETTGGVTYVTEIYTYQDGTKQTVTLSYI